MEPLSEAEIKRCAEWNIPMYGRVFRVYGSQSHALHPNVYEERPTPVKGSMTGKIRIRKKGLCVLIAKGVVYFPYIFHPQWSMWVDIWDKKYDYESRNFDSTLTFNRSLNGTYESYLRDKMVASLEGRKNAAFSYQLKPGP